MRKIVNEKTRIGHDVRHGGGGFFAFIPSVSSGVHEETLKEDDGFYWFSLFENDVLKSVELFHCDISDFKVDFSEGTGYSSDYDKGSVFGGLCKRSFNPSETYSPEHVVFRNNLASGGSQAYIFDRRKSLKIEVRPFLRASGVSQWLVGDANLVGTLENGAGQEYTFPDADFSAESIIGFSGVISGAPTFFYDDFPTYCSGSGRFYFEDIDYRDDFAAAFSSDDVGTENLYDYTDLPTLVPISTFYANAVFYQARLNSFDREFDGPMGTGSGAGFLPIFSPDAGGIAVSGYNNIYGVDVSNLSDSYISSYSVVQMPFLSVYITDSFSGYSGAEIRKASGNSEEAHVYLLYQDLPTSINSTGEGENYFSLVDDMYGEPQEFKGFYNQNHPNFYTGHDLTVTGRKQGEYRDYAFVPDVSNAYDVRLYKVLENADTGYSPYSYHEVEMYEKETQTGVVWISNAYPLDTCTFIQSSATLPSDLDCEFYAICEFSSTLPFSSVTNISDTPVNISARKGNVLILKPNPFETGQTILRFAQTGDSYFANSSVNLTINWKEFAIGEVVSTGSE